MVEVNKTTVYFIFLSRPRNRVEVKNNILCLLGELQV